MTVFNHYAEFYDLLYADKDYQSESEYVLSLVKKFSKIEVKEILNMGCGTGSHDPFLIKDGVSVCGIDLSVPMIKIAKTNAEEKQISHWATYEAIAIKDYYRSKPYDCVLSLFHVASYQTSNDDLETFFKTAWKNLKTSGLFIFDFWYGPAVLSDPPMQRTKHVENETWNILRNTHPQLFPNENIAEINFELIIENKLNHSTENISEQHLMRYLFLPELKLIAERIGFSIEGSFKWMNGESPLDLDSWYGIIVASKK